ncbi:MAG TPA: ChaN family lipoprotein [Saprospiraceae bacterium]|nr:ChaN family lipoprotein [Saprospiraceae bacterium]HNT19046.1 ChaN family lipoprotein [Saprospiraceae bacterium]
MKLKLPIIVIMNLVVISGMFSQSLPAYQLFTGKGKKLKYAQLLKRTAGKDLVLFGEEHNNPIAHWLQLRLTRDCSKQQPLVLGAEMIERDNQDELEAYLQGTITAKQLDSTARLWSNYKTDYAPLVNFAKQNKIPFIGTNIPRRFASLVAKNGFEALDTLSDLEKSWIAPLPVKYDAELPGYKNMLTIMAGHGGPNLPKAQAIKDATMAHFILQNLNPETLFIHYHGSYHSENYEGILWYLLQEKPQLKYLTIATVSQTSLQRLDPGNLGKADVILAVDADMTKTY